MTDDSLEAAERQRYHDACLRGDAAMIEDAIKFDEVRSMKLLAKLVRVDRSVPAGDIDADAIFRDVFRSSMQRLYLEVAADHARKCRENGWPT